MNSIFITKNLYNKKILRICTFFERKLYDGQFCSFFFVYNSISLRIKKNISYDLKEGSLKNIEKKSYPGQKNFFSVLRLPHPLPLLHLATGLVKRNLIRSFRITPLSNKFPLLQKS